ncbi:MAG: D-cysteine desulfhydrase family protein [Pseudomonadota bacterium]
MTGRVSQDGFVRLGLADIIPYIKGVTACHPLLDQPTPLQYLDRLSDRLGIELYVKRDDLAGPSFGGNKTRQLQYYFGDALQQRADTILITGAVQSNYVRLAAAIANALGLTAIVQLEHRVDTDSQTYAQSGNVLLNQLLGAQILTYPVGEDEAGADRALEDKADELRSAGWRPYVIHLGEGHPPLGALGYVDAAREILTQRDDFDAFVVASGSGATHAGLLAGLKGEGHGAHVFGSCVRRAADLQALRIARLLTRLAPLYPGASKVQTEDINIWGGALAPGYGKVGPAAMEAMQLMAREAGLILDPVYTAKAFAAVPGLLKEGVLTPGQRVCFVHTGGLASTFAYQDVLSKLMSDN